MANVCGTQEIQEKSSTSIEANVRKRSFIDASILESKNKKRKITDKKSFLNLNNPASLQELCKCKIIPHFEKLRKYLTRRREEPWKKLNYKLVAGKEAENCREIIKNIDRQYAWLTMINTGKVSMVLFKLTFKDEEIFYREKHQKIIDENILDFPENIKTTITKLLKNKMF